jgi:single-strand DNA-binding protein
MASVNKTIIIGNLGADPEVRYTSSGKAVAELRVATSFKSGDSETTEWHRVIAWDVLGENAGKYLSKGKSVYVEGRIQTRSYDDKDGNKRYVTEIVAERMQFLSPKGADSAAVDDAPAESTSRKKPGRKPRVEPQETADGDDDPFAA